MLLALLLVAPAALASGVPADRATAVQREQAQTRFARGKSLFDDRKYDEALEEFRASHQIVSSPNTRLMMARCLQELGRMVEAYAEFGRTAVEARELEHADRRYRQAAESAEEERRELESLLGFLIVDIRNARDDTTLKVGSEEIRRAAWGEPTPTTPGETEVIVQTPGRQPVRKSVSLSAGQRSEITIDADTPMVSEAQVDVSQTPPTTSGNQRTWAYVAGGIGVVGLTTFTVGGLMANSTYKDLDASCGGPCPPDRQDDIDAGKRQQTIANIGLAVGLIGISTGVVLYLSSSPNTTSPEPSTSIVVSPGWVGLQGRM